MCAQQQDWKKTAIRASNLSKLELTLGKMAAALRDAEHSVDLADRSDYDFVWLYSRTTLANARHQSGRRADALVLFREAEAIPVQQQPECPLLYSVRGFQYCDLLLGDAERIAWVTCMASNSAATDRFKLEPPLDTLPEVEQRAMQTLEWVTTQNWLLDMALDRLTLGRVALYRAVLEDLSF